LFGFADPVYLVFDFQMLSGLLFIIAPGINRVSECATAMLIHRRIARSRMERYGCSKCNEEYFMKNVPITGPPPGPHFCPECSGELHHMGTEFGWIPNSYDMD
jgi:hypothetical protein